MKINVTIKGVTPLLMSKFTEDQLQPNKKTNKNITPKESAEKYAYRDENGQLCIPGECIYACLIEAGKFHKKGKNKVTTFKKTLITAGVEHLEGNYSLGTKDFDVDSRAAVVPATGGRIMVHRPMLKDWQISFQLEIDPNEFSIEDIRTYMNDAGKKCGLLAYRPACKGWFGKFEIVKWEVLK